jgi:DNA modification methylase
MKILTKSVNSLVPYALNNRKHSEKQTDRIASSIAEFGFNQPIVVDNNDVVIVGHGRLEAAKKLGLKEVPVVEVGELTDAQIKAYRILDNKLQNDSEWNIDNLQLEFGVLSDLDFDLSFGGLDELSSLFDKEEPEIAEDDFEPEEIDEPFIKQGDLIELGRHRLLCGDSTNESDFNYLMNNQKSDLCFTSPPYNASANTPDGDVFNGKKSKQMYDGKYSDNLPSEEYVSFAQKVLGLCFKNTSGFIFWNVGYNANAKSEYIKQIVPFLDHLIEQVCWKKDSAIPVKGCMRRAWEPIFIFSSTKKSLELKTVESNLWEISNRNCQMKNHKACFPVSLPSKAFQILSKSETVLDPFLGSGTTLIAAEQLGRTCYGMELSPKYCQVILERYKKHCEDNNKAFECKINGEEYKA